MRWLSSPAVAVLSLLATVITLGQFGFSACRWAAERTHAEDTITRAYAAVIVAGFAVLAVIAPLTWMTIYHVSAKLGQTHWVALLYPPSMLGSALCGLLVLSVANSERWPARERLMPCSLLLIGFGGVALIYLVSGAPVWERVLVSGIPGLLMAAVVVISIAYATRRFQASAGVEGESAPAR